MKPWSDIFEDLRGTCENLSSYLENNELEHLEDDHDFLAQLDQNIFLCECCGWWYPVSEASEDYDATICVDCADD